MDNLDTSGFYANVDGQLLYAPNRVMNKNFQLLRETHTINTYPIGGWYWFDSEEEASINLGISNTEVPDEQQAVEELVKMLEVITNG
jgi:hypothetical protein